MFAGREAPMRGDPWRYGPMSGAAVRLEARLRRTVNHVVIARSAATADPVSKEDAHGTHR
ncbi:hypothetical protein JCM13591A_23940 [Microbacterium xylanilyticum]